MATTGSISGAHVTASRHWKVTFTGVTQSSNCAPFLGRGYQTSSFVLSGTLGAGASLQWQGSNDGGVTWVNIGVPISSLPAGGTVTPAGVNYELYQLLVTGGDGTTSINGRVDFASNNAS